MKAAIFTTAALAGLASAGAPSRRANHDNLFKAGKRAHVTGAIAATASEECGCSTVYTTWYGEPTLVFPSPVAYANTTSKPVQVAEVTPVPVLNTTTVPVPSSIAINTTIVPVSSSIAITPSTTVSKSVTVPTPAVETCPTAGVYTFPATTIVVTETTTVCGATTTVLPSGTHTYGGVTTTVDQPCTITAAVPVESTGTDAVVTSVVSSTVYVCPAAGTYTINPKTTTVTKDSQTVVYPTVTSFLPGTYSKDVVVVTATVDEYVTVCPWVGGPVATSYSTEAYAPTTTAVAISTVPSVVSDVVPSIVSNVPSVVSNVPSVVSNVVPSIVSNVVPSVVSNVPSVVASVASSVASVVSSATKSVASSYPTTGALFPGQKADHWAITYTPYTGDTGACKSKSAVYEDIQNIKDMGFTTVRVYSTDCDTLTNVGGACEEYGIRMIIGIFIKEVGCAYSGEVQEQVEGIISWGKFNIVDMLVVGNEAVFGGLCSASQLSSLITTVKSQCTSAGYTGPFSTAETVDVWQTNGETLCSVIDIAGAQTHPYFNAETTPSTSGSFVKGQIDIVKSVCGKPAISLECGWPTEGSCNGAACPGVSEQKEAMASVRDICGEEVVFFTYGEAHWKSPGSCGCEPFFDIKSIFESL